jgi:hypothetical protein
MQPVNTPIAKMFREMMAKGVDPEMIALAIETAESVSRPVESPVDTAAEKRRAYDRERKRLERLSGGSPVDIPVDGDSAISFLGTKEVSKEEKKERAKSGRGEKLPPDAKPTADHYEQGLALGFGRDWVDHQFEDMRIWARTNEHRAVARKSDWNLTFTGWLRRVAKDAKGRSNGNGTSDNRANPAAGRATAREAQHVATMGGAALRFLQDGKSAGAGRGIPDGPDVAGGPDPIQGAKNAH